MHGWATSEEIGSLAGGGEEGGFIALRGVMDFRVDNANGCAS
jgi:hypothetical protein